MAAATVPRASWVFSSCASTREERLTLNSATYTHASGKQTPADDSSEVSTQQTADGSRQTADVSKYRVRKHTRLLCAVCLPFLVHVQPGLDRRQLCCERLYLVPQPVDAHHVRTMPAKQRSVYSIRGDEGGTALGLCVCLWQHARVYLANYNHA